MVNILRNNKHPAKMSKAVKCEFFMANYFDK